MSECTPATVMQWPELNADKADSWGYPTPFAENLIAEPGEAALVPTGEDGEIVYRGPTVMEGYWNNPDANAEVFTGGRLHSGDLGRIDAEGVVWFTDRMGSRIGRLDPVTGEIRQYPTPRPHTAPYGIAVDRTGQIWYAGSGVGSVGRLDPQTGAIREYPIPGATVGPNAVVATRDRVWFTLRRSHQYGWLDPETGELREPEEPELEPDDVGVGVGVGAGLRVPTSTISVTGSTERTDTTTVRETSTPSTTVI